MLKKIFYFCGSFLPSWIRIRIPNPDPDPLTRLNPDPIRIRIRNPGKYSRGPTFEDFVTFRTEGSMQDVSVARLDYRVGTRVQTTLSPLFKIMYCGRVSLSVDSQNIPCATLKRRGSWVISVYLWVYCTSFPDPERFGTVRFRILGSKAVNLLFLL
jgi:hypothetical protein